METIKIKVKDMIHAPDKDHLRAVQINKATVTKNKKKYTRKDKHKNKGQDRDGI